MVKEFKEFLMRGNVVDLAVAVIIGAAFGKIVSALVEQIITPVIGILIGGKGFEDLSYTYGTAKIGYGVFIQSVLDFVIIGFVLFMIIKAMEKAKRLNPLAKKEEICEDEIVEELSKEQEILSEIRDLLKSQQK